MPQLGSIERKWERGANTIIRWSMRPLGILRSVEYLYHEHSWLDPYQAGSEENPHPSSGISLRCNSNLFSALSKYENVPIGVILDLLQESPVLGAIFCSEARHNNNFSDPPVLSVHASAAIRAGRISLAAPCFDLAGLVVLHLDPCSRVRV